jgi:hypothetical protein
MYVKGLAALLLGAFSLTLLTGCPSADPRLRNQGGGSLVSAGLKIAQNRIHQLTPDELQILADAVVARTPDLDVVVTDEQAADAVAFIQENNLKSVSDVEALIAQAQQDPDSIEIPDSILLLIQSF